jgi:Tol biopolymer transport system component
VTSEHAYIEFLDVSPDGMLLALSSDRRGNQDLWVLPAAGGDMSPLTTDPTPDWSPRWSPDGREIAFYAYRNGNRDIWVMPSRGGPARQLTSHPSQETNPAWSPDGHEIAFYSQKGTGGTGTGSWMRKGANRVS